MNHINTNRISSPSTAINNNTITTQAAAAAIVSPYDASPAMQAAMRWNQQQQRQHSSSQRQQQHPSSQQHCIPMHAHAVLLDKVNHALERELLSKSSRANELEILYFAEQRVAKTLLEKNTLLVQQVQALRWTVARQHEKIRTMSLANNVLALDRCRSMATTKGEEEEETGSGCVAKLDATSTSTTTTPSNTASTYLLGEGCPVCRTHDHSFSSCPIATDHGYTIAHATTTTTEQHPRQGFPLFSTNQQQQQRKQQHNNDDTAAAVPPRFSKEIIDLLDESYDDDNENDNNDNDATENNQKNNLNNNNNNNHSDDDDDDANKKPAARRSTDHQESDGSSNSNNNNNSGTARNRHHRNRNRHRKRPRSPIWRIGQLVDRVAASLYDDDEDGDENDDDGQDNNENDKENEEEEDSEENSEEEHGSNDHEDDDDDNDEDEDEDGDEEDDEDIEEEEESDEDYTETIHRRLVRPDVPVSTPVYRLRSGTSQLVVTTAVDTHDDGRGTKANPISIDLPDDENNEMAVERNTNTSPLQQHDDSGQSTTNSAPTIDDHPTMEDEDDFVCQEIPAAILTNNNSIHSLDADNNNNNNIHDDEIQIVGTTGKNALSDFAHPRYDCVTKRFDRDPTVYCDNCYCYVCDVRASDCEHWTGEGDNSHCFADRKVLHWKRRRARLICKRLRPQRALREIAIYLPDTVPQKLPQKRKTRGRVMFRPDGEQQQQHQHQQQQQQRAMELVSSKRRVTRSGSYPDSNHATPKTATARRTTTTTATATATATSAPGNPTNHKKRTRTSSTTSRSRDRDTPRKERDKNKSRHRNERSATPERTLRNSRNGRFISGTHRQSRRRRR